MPFLPLVVRRECRNVLLVLMSSSFLNLIYTKSNVVTNPHKTHHLDGFRCFVKTCLTVDQRSLSGVEAKTLKRAEPGKRAGGRQRRARTTGGGGPSQWRAVIRLRSSALGGRELTGHLAGRSGPWALGNLPVVDRESALPGAESRNGVDLTVSLSFCRFRENPLESSSFVRFDYCRPGCKVIENDRQK